MKKTLMASVLTLALAASAFAAPRAGDLTSGVANGDWLGFGIRDISALPDRPADTLLARAMNLAGDQGGAMLRQAGALDVRATIKDGDFEKVDRFALAAELKDASLAQLTQMAPGAQAPDFTVTAPEGTKITPVASVTAEEKVGKVNVALLERDGAVYLIAANGAPEVLADMAKAPENSPLVVAKTPANIWIQVNATRETFEKSDAGLPGDFFAEFGIDDTATTVKVIFWSNLVDVLDAALKDDEDSPLKNKSLRDVFTGGVAVKAPLVFGQAPLYALLNLSASFLPENFKLSDIAPAEDAAEAEKEVVAQISQAGYTWEDLVKQLRGNTTIGFAGKLSAPMVGEIPGVFVNVTGIDAAKAKGILDLAAAQLGGMLGTPAGYNANGWTGYQFSGMVSLLLATGPDGLLAAAMNADQFGTVSDVPAGMASAVEPRNVALAFNLKELQPVLKRVFEQWGDQLLEMAGESAKSQKATIQMVLDNMGYLETFSIVTVDENTIVFEFTPSAELVNQALPPAPAAEAPAPAEVKPAA